MALGADPHLALAVRAELGKAGVGLDIALMGGLGLVGVFHQKVGGGKARLEIAVAVFDIAHDVGMKPLGHRIIGCPRADRRSARLHRLVHVGDVRQHLVFNLNELGGFTGQKKARGGNGGNGVAVIKRHLARHAVFLNVPVLALKAGREIGAGDNGLHALERERLGGVDLLDLGMGMGRADHYAMQHPRRIGIGAIARLARHLVDAIGAIRTGADIFETGGLGIQRHHTPSRMSAAASSTARIILS